MIFDGVEYKPNGKGKFYCPRSCGDPRYPQPSWKTEKGFTRHLEECKKNQWAPAPTVENEKFCDCPDCGTPIMNLTSCWKMGRKTVCIGCYRPYFEAGEGFHGPAGWEPPGITLEG